jgi:hypothetical protein
MRASFLIGLLSLPFYVSSQQQQSSTPTQSASASQSASQSVILSTSFSLVETFGPDRVPGTSTQAIVVTITPSPSASGNGTASGNSTVSGSSNSTSSTKSKTLSSYPTAPTDIDGGGQNGAPVPGASSSNGIYGPGDSYVAAAAALRRNAFLVGVFGVVVGGALVLL